MSPVKTLLSATLLSLIASTSLAGTNGPIKTVTLSSGGLAEIVRSADVANDSRVSIDVPLHQVDDFLKSLVVRDAKGAVKGLTLNGPNPLEETFQNLPFKPGDLTSLPKLLDSIKGAKVSLANKNDIATVLGVSTVKAADGEERAMLSLLWPNGSLSSVPVNGTSITIADPDIRTKLQGAMDVIGNGSIDSTRKIDLALAGEGNRSVELSYVVAAPIWKTSYRLVKTGDGSARLQAWAVFENASGEDWNDVDITLSSGKPVTLKQKLHQRYWRDRTELQVDTQAVALAQPKMMRNQAMVAMAPAPAADAMMFSEAARGASFEMAGIEQQAETSEGDVASSFALPEKLSVKNGETVSVPLVEGSVKAEMVSLYSRERGGNHPVAAALLDNDGKISLPQGILTVYDDKAGYVGDAKIENFPVGQTQAVNFAIDQKVTIDVEDVPHSRVANIKVVDGTIHVTHAVETRTKYRIKAPSDAPRTIVVEQMHQPGSTFKSNATIEQENNKDRMKVTLQAGEERELEAVVSSDHQEVVALMDIDPSQIELYLQNTQDDETKTKLKALADVRRKLMDAQRALAKIDEQSAEVMAAQANTRENLQSVPPGDLKERFMHNMGQQQDRLDRLSEERAAAVATISEHDQDVRDAIRRF